MKPELIIQLPPLRPDGQRELQAQARQGDMLAVIILRPYWPESQTYVLEHYWDRTNRAIRRKLTPGQDERGRVLASLLRERLKENLVTAGWQDAGTNYEGRLLWRYVGPATSELPPASHAPVTTPLRGTGTPPAPVLQERGLLTPASKRIAVAGEQQPRHAYSRMLTTRLVTFTCRQCGQQVSQQRFPGPTPRYCSEACKQEALRAGTLARVQRFRARQQEQRDKQP
jgi:hypothetical protein